MFMDLRQLQRVANFFGLGGPPKEPQPVRIGVLGASQVATYAAIWPCQRLPSASVLAVAARDAKRAQEYAKQNRVPRSYGSYDELLADPDVDAVYVGLPNGLHGQWARKALEAGKHVLCEKPFGANAHEAVEVQDLARKQGLLCREAFHYREHPLATRLRELTLGPSTSSDLPAWLQQPASPGGAAGSLGKLKRVHVRLLIPQWVFGDANIRFQEQLAGGAMMDAGCYCVSMLRLLTGEQPRVTTAAAELRPESQVLDGAMQARVEWPALPGLQGTLHASLQHPGWLPVTEVHAEGELGSLVCSGFVLPFFGNRVRVRRRRAADSSGVGGTGQEDEWVERVFGPDQETTYHHQLNRFVADLRALESNRNDRRLQAALQADAADCVSNQEVIDQVYSAAGLPLRLPTHEWLARQQANTGKH